jgi:hypothetical protein
MKSRNILIVLLVLVVGVGGWYAFRPERLFVNQKVSESLPAASPAMAADARGSAMSASTEGTAMGAPGSSPMPTTVTMGRFHKGAHDTHGVATVYEQADGSRVLRLTDFGTSNGPDVHVYLVAANDAADNETVTRKGYVDLGSLKGNLGDQNYTIPANVDLDRYRAVTIWCARFHVNFGTAPLEKADAASAVHDAMASPARPDLNGSFHTGAHETRGMAGVYAIGGRQVLRLTNFETSNGPDVHVYLVAASDAKDNDTVTRAGYLDLGSLKGNIGDQNYEIPAGTDLSHYRAVTIWCARFHVNFGTAPLEPVRS